MSILINIRREMNHTITTLDAPKVTLTNYHAVPVKVTGLWRTTRIINEINLTAQLPLSHRVTELNRRLKQTSFGGIDIIISTFNLH